MQTFHIWRFYPRIISCVLCLLGCIENLEQHFAVCLSLNSKSWRRNKVISPWCMCFFRLAMLFFRVGFPRSSWLDGIEFGFGRFLLLPFFYFFFSSNQFILQCGSISSCCYIFYHLVVYPICWWFLQPYIWEAWHWHIW